MQGNRMFATFHFGGTLAANQTMTWKAPEQCTLVALSANASNDSDATITIGTAADPDGFLTAKVIGDSDAGVVYGKADWDGALVTDRVTNPNIAKDAVIQIVLDFDGAAGTAAQNVTIVAVFAD